jgi:hypothetical protein
VKKLKLIGVVFLCLCCCGPASWAQSDGQKLPTAVILTLNRRFPGWKFADVSPEVRKFVKEELKAASPVLISGDFDGDRRLDYAALIRRGYVFNSQGQAIEPRHYLVIFLRRNTRYKMYVIKDPGGEYLILAKKGTSDYNYNEQKEITYANDAILTGIFEKGGMSYVYKKGKFISFVSSD